MSQRIDWWILYVLYPAVLCGWHVEAYIRLNPSPVLEIVQISTRTHQEVLLVRVRNYYFSRASKSMFYVQFLLEHIKEWPYPPSIIFPCPPSSVSYVQISTRTHQVFALSSKYFSMTIPSICPLLQVQLSTYKSLPKHIKYLLYSQSMFPCPPSIFLWRFLPEHIKYLPCHPSIFLRTIFTRTHQVFALSSKYFLLSSKRIWRQ